MEVALRKLSLTPIRIFYKQAKDIDVLATCLPDPCKVICRNVSMAQFAMCCLLMQNVSENIKNEYNCLHDQVLTDPKKLVE